jgi:hypothetical protein
MAGKRRRRHSGKAAHIKKAKGHRKSHSSKKTMVKA